MNAATFSKYLIEYVKDTAVKKIIKCQNVFDICLKDYLYPIQPISTDKHFNYFTDQYISDHICINTFTANWLYL